MAGDTGPWLTAVAAIGGIFGAAISFVLGSRVSKDQADRDLLRALSQELLGQFSEIATAIGDQKPRLWSSYPLAGPYCMTSLRKMRFDGRSSLLPDHVLKALSNAEIEVLSKAGALHECLWKTFGPEAITLISATDASDL